MSYRQRRMDESSELYRAVVRRYKMVPNPDYDYAKGWNQYVDGERVPSQIPSETETYVTIYGPYTTKGAATAQKNRNSSDGWGGPVAGAHVEKAIVTWEVVE